MEPGFAIQLTTLLGTFGVGVVLSFLGAVKIPLAERLNIDDARVGGLISALMFSSMIAVLLAGAAVDAIGHQQVIVFGFILCGLCIIGIGVIPSYALVVIACILLGLGGMSLSSAAAVLAQKVLFPDNPALSQNLNNVFFGLGAFITPMVVAILVKRISFQGTMTVLAIIMLLPLLAAISATYPEMKGGAGYSIMQAIDLLKNPNILLAGLVLFFYVALEATMGGWVTTYLSKLGASSAKAGVVLSLFWISLMMSRLLMVLLQVPDNWALAIVVVLALVATLSIFIMTITKSLGVGIAAVIVTGLVFGPTFPNIIGTTLSWVEPKLQGSTYGIIFAMGLLGASIIPALVGIYSRNRTIQKSLRLAAGAGVALFLVALILLLMNLDMLTV
jgi:fucose permease